MSRNRWLDEIGIISRVLRTIETRGGGLCRLCLLEEGKFDVLTEGGGTPTSSTWRKRSFWKVENIPLRQMPSQPRPGIPRGSETREEGPSSTCSVRPRKLKAFLVYSPSRDIGQGMEQYKWRGFNRPWQRLGGGHVDRRRAIRGGSEIWDRSRIELGPTAGVVSVGRTFDPSRSLPRDYSSVDITIVCPRRVLIAGARY